MVNFNIKKKLAPAARRLKRGTGVAIGTTDATRLGTGFKLFKMKGKKHKYDEDYD